MVAVSYQPWYVGDTDPQWDLPLNTDAGPDDITGINIGTFTLTFRTTQGVDTLGTGIFSVKTLSPAEVYYQPSDADVAVPFNGKLFVKAVLSTGKKRVWDPYDFIISAS